MGQHSRVLWLLFWPFLVTTVAHGSLEQLTSIDIEHNLKIDEKICRTSSGTPKPLIAAFRLDLRPDVPVHYDITGQYNEPERTAARTEPLNQIIPESVRRLRSIRLLI